MAHLVWLPAQVGCGLRWVAAVPMLCCVQVKQLVIKATSSSLLCPGSRKGGRLTKPSPGAKRKLTCPCLTRSHKTQNKATQSSQVSFSIPSPQMLKANTPSSSSPRHPLTFQLHHLPRPLVFLHCSLSFPCSLLPCIFFFFLCNCHTAASASPLLCPLLFLQPKEPQCFPMLRLFFKPLIFPCAHFSSSLPSDSTLLLNSNLCALSASHREKPLNKEGKSRAAHARSDLC